MLSICYNNYRSVDPGVIHHHHASHCNYIIYYRSPDVPSAAVVYKLDQSCELQVWQIGLDINISKAYGPTELKVSTTAKGT